MSIRAQRLKRFTEVYYSYAERSPNAAHIAAVLRKLTLRYRKDYQDDTKDGFTSPCWHYVFVGGRYHHILDKENFAKYCLEYKASGNKSWHTVTEVNCEPLSNNIINNFNIRISGFFNLWFSGGDALARISSIKPGDNVLLEQIDGSLKITGWSPFSVHDLYPPKDDVSEGDFVWNSYTKTLNKEFII